MAISTAVDASAVARVVGIKTEYRNLRFGAVTFLPQRIAVVAQGSTAATYDTTKRQIFTEAEAGQTYGFGSPIHLAVKQLLPNNGDGVGSIPVTVYPLEDAVGAVAAAGDITPVVGASTTLSYQVRVNNILSQAFSIAPADTVAAVVTKMTAAINAILDMPVVAADNTTDVTITAKWAGASGNDLHIEIVGDTTDNTFAITQPTGGATNPDVDDALDQVGTVWETLFLNAMDIADTATLDKFSAFGEGRWGALVRKPMIAFTGNTAASVSAATAVSDARGSDRVNSQLVAPGSNDLPFVVAARQLARIAVGANNKPASDYAGAIANGLTPGADGVQWNYAQRDTAVKSGSSTVEVKDGLVTLSDTVTFYHPVGDPTPAYRYVRSIVQLMNVIFNLDLIFATPEWNGAPLIPDDQPTVNRDAKKPKMAVAAVAAMIDNLGAEAILSDPATAKQNIQAGINSGNPNRLDVAVTVQLSGSTNIISVDLGFGFYFGAAA